MGELKVKFLMGPSDSNDANVPNYGAEFLGNLSRALGEKVVCAEMDEVRAQPLPVYFIASGGAGRLEDFRDVIREADASAVLAASLFHYKELEIRQVKEYLKNCGIPVRMWK